MGNTLKGCTTSWRRAERAEMMSCKGLFAGLVFGCPDVPVFVFMQLADQDRPKVNTPHPLSHRPQSNIVSHKSFSHKPPRSTPTHLAVAFDPTSLPSLGIIPRLNHCRHSPVAPLIVSHRKIHAQALMRPLLIIMPQPLVAASLLFPRPPSRSFGHLRFVYPMKLFMRSIFTRPAWSGKFHFNPQLHPPRAQTRQPGRTTATKRGPIIAPDPLRQPITPENPSKFSCALGHALAGQQRYPQAITAIKITHGQRIHPRSVSSAIPTFEIHSPYLVGLARRTHRPSPDTRSSQSPSPPFDQSPAMEPSIQRGHRGPANQSWFLAQTMMQLARSPRRMLFSQPPQPFQPMAWRSPGNPFRATGLIQQSAQTLLSIAPTPLVGRLAGHMPASAQIAHRLTTSLHRPHQFIPLFLLILRFPRHRPLENCHLCYEYNLLPML